MKKDKSEECKGCTFITRDEIEYKRHCAFILGKIREHCPCFNCLVKVMCDKKDCLLRNRAYLNGSKIPE